MAETRVKASDLTDERFMDRMLDVFENGNVFGSVGNWTTTWDLEEAFPSLPPKVIIAKAKRLIGRGLIEGCDCGCRGDFEFTAEGLDRMHERGISGKRLKRYARTRCILRRDPSQPYYKGGPEWKPAPSNATEEGE